MSYCTCVGYVNDKVLLEEKCHRCIGICNCALVCVVLQEPGHGTCWDINLNVQNLSDQNVSAEML